jgi:hypothetical protein
MLAFLTFAAAVVAASGERFSPPSRGVVLVSETTVPVAWSSPCRPDANEAELVLSLDDGITFGVRVSGPLAPCAASFRWRVPGLSSTSARLAVRKGRKGRPESERIVLVSERFTILPTGTSPSPPPTRGAIEWWTDQALFDVSAQDWLEQTMGSLPTCRADHAAEAETDDPDPEPEASSGPQRTRLALTASRRHDRQPRRAGLQLPSQLPLRL